MVAAKAGSNFGEPSFKSHRRNRGKKPGEKLAAEKMHVVARVTAALSELDDIFTREEH